MLFTIFDDIIPTVINMTKYKILSILIKEKDYISGEIISEKLGISRAAVNSAIKNLRIEGYEIDSVTNRGYRLQTHPNHLNEGEIGAFLSDARMKTVCCLESVDSTNNHLRNLAYDGAPEGQVVISDHQTEGKGRHGRRFESPSHSGIYLSYLLRPNTKPGSAVEITAWTAVAVCSAIEEITGFSPDIKWINDLESKGKKLCGILSELSVEAESGEVKFIIVGIGVNVNENTGDFPEELVDVATSLKIETEKDVRRGELAAAIVRHMDFLKAEWPEEHEKYYEEYCKRCVTPGNRIRVITGGSEEEAYAKSIDLSFGLVVEYPDGSEKILNSGEVSTRKI